MRLFVTGYINSSDSKTLSLCNSKFNVDTTFRDELDALFNLRIDKTVFTVKFKQLFNVRASFSLTIDLALL